MVSLLLGALLEPAIIAPIVLAASIFFLIVRPLYFSPMSHVPGPALCKISWYYLSCFDLRYERNTQIHKWHQKYGPVVCIRPNEISFSSPTYMREIYGSTGRYEKSDYFNNFIAYGERAMFSTLGYHDHHKKRRMLSSFYQATSIKQPAILGFVRERATAFMNVVRSSQRQSVSVNLFPHINRFAFDNITNLLYGPNHGTHAIESDKTAQKLLHDLKGNQFLGPLYHNFRGLYSVFGLLAHFAWPHKSGGFVAGTQLEQWTSEKIESTVRDTTPMSDTSLLSRLLTVRDSSKQFLSRNFIASELTDNVNAAQETVSVALAYFVWHLSRHTDWQQRIRAELKALPVHPDDNLPNNTDLEAAPLLEAFLKEVYRVNPGSSGRAERLVPAGGRHYGPTYLPEGTVVSASTIALHQDPGVFRNPESFQPERWLDSSPTDLKMMENSFIPFGYGARICTGKAFATIQIKTLIAALYLRYSTRIADGVDEKAMWQTGTQDALPWGLSIDVVLQED